MCILRSSAENSTESEWGPSGSDRYVEEPSGGSGASGGMVPAPSSSPPAKRRTIPRNPSARAGAASYRHVVALLSEPQVLDAVQHALSSSVLSSQGFGYGRREQLLQSLVTCLHALCTMDQPLAPQGEGEGGEGGGAATRSAGPLARHLALVSSTSSALAGQAGSADTSTHQVAAAIRPLLERLSAGTCGKLVQLLQPSGGAGGGSGAASGLDPSLSEACLCLLSLMTTSQMSRKLLLSVPPPGALGCLSAIIANTVAASRAGGSGGAGGGGGPTPGATPRGMTPRSGGGAASAMTSASAAAAAIRHIGAAYLGGGVGSPRGDVDEGVVWGRCQALAAKAMRNLAVSEPAAFLQHRNAVPSLLAALLGPAPPHPFDVEGARFEATPLPSPRPSPRPSAVPPLRPPPPPTAASAIIAPVAWRAGQEPGWMLEVQRNALAALVNLTAKVQAAAACAAVVDAGGIPVIVEVRVNERGKWDRHDVVLGGSARS